MKLPERREASNKAHSEKLNRMLGDAENYTDKVMENHHETASHLKPTQVKQIVDTEIDKGVARRRADRPGRKKGGRAKGDVNIIIASKAPGSDMQSPAAPPIMAAPPRPPIPPQLAPPAGGDPGVMPPGMGAAPPPQGMSPGAGIPPMRKKGGKAVKLDGGAGGALGRLEKAADYGARK